MKTKIENCLLKVPLNQFSGIIIKFNSLIKTSNWLSVIAILLAFTLSIMFAGLTPKLDASSL